MEQKTELQEIQQTTAIIYSKQDSGVGRGHSNYSSEYYTSGDLPYPFTGMEELVSNCSSINFAAEVDGVVYKLQTVHMVPRISLVA